LFDLGPLVAFKAIGMDKWIEEEFDRESFEIKEEDEQLDGLRS
jgi:hypothetical protein